jgi:hypothetical protein
MFEEDLMIGKEAELDFAWILLKRGKWTISNIELPEWKFEDYDMMVTYPSWDISFEVKKDNIRPRSREIWIEFQDGWRPSGISASKADFYVYNLGWEYWSTPRSRLLNLLLTTENKRLCQWGDSWEVKLWVIPENEFYSIAKKIDEPTRETNTANSNTSNTSSSPN